MLEGDLDNREASLSALRSERGGCAVVSLAGRVGIGDCAWVRPLLDLQAVHGQDRLVVDLSRLSSMDWWVALILLWTARVVDRRGGLLVLASPQPSVARVLDAAGAPKVVTMYDSVQHAIGDVAVSPLASA